MTLNKLITEQQERNREKYRCGHQSDCELIGEYHGTLTELSDLDEIIKDTAEAVRDWMVEIVSKKFVRGTVGVDLSPEDVQINYVLKNILTQLQANKDLSEKD